VFDQADDLTQRQHARDDRALNVELLMVETQRAVIGRRALHRQMQSQRGPVRRGVIENADVGDDQRIHTEVGGGIDGGLPALPASGCG